MANFWDDFAKGFSSALSGVGSVLELIPVGAVSMIGKGMKIGGTISDSISGAVRGKDYANALGGMNLTKALSGSGSMGGGSLFSGMSGGSSLGGGLNASGGSGSSGSGFSGGLGSLFSGLMGSSAGSLLGSGTAGGISSLFQGLGGSNSVGGFISGKFFG
jgi:hypothetical protein